MRVDREESVLYYLPCSLGGQRHREQVARPHAHVSHTGEVGDDEVGKLAEVSQLVPGADNRIVEDISRATKPGHPDAGLIILPQSGENEVPGAYREVAGLLADIGDDGWRVALVKDQTSTGV